ncbi:hypothetical protein PPERSA_12229 [Pseudocohnilembus persalinus]|uniref:Uncharacterized protein n=1 Tax=Pseudocohnilembus persalinus TaxID=266149 RepID=A0A0V0R4T2_PSEPJ|nr:hypothetical protein PPERSA_12229 [Pseudocohnilembus persalinus]|eukprot:KRX09486.1 hypothetical protein PPERSA_12229 [Pseudocohnilembus persalinus]
MDMFYQLESVTREMKSVSKIYFQACQLSYNHLKMLKGFIAYGKYSFLTLILDQNNLDFQEIDGFFFGNSNVVRNKIKEDKICIIIVNNNGIFKQGYAEILKQKLQDKIVIDKRQGLIYTQTSQLKERQEDLVNERVRNYLQINFRKGVENDDQESIESLNYLFPNNKISFVEKINLSDIQINNFEIAKSLFTNIFKNRGLKSFIMQNMNTVTFEALCDVFYKQENINLNKIDLSGSDLSTKDIYKFFKSKLNQIKFKQIKYIKTFELDLSVNKLILRNTKLNNKSLQALENSLKKNKSFKKSLRMIDLSSNPLIDNYNHLGRVIQQFKFLKILNLKQMNGLMQKKFYQIFQKHASGRKKNQNIFENLHEINFQNNKNMQPEGLVNLIKELEKFVNLEKLTLSQCDLGDEYIKQWGKNQKIFQIIKKIDISENNRIGPLGWGHFFEILGDSQRIEKIKMQSCALSQESLSKITEKIFYIKKRSKFAQNLVTNLKCLDFRRNNYQQQLMIQSQNMINSNNQINMNNNNINNINNNQLNQSNNGGNLAKIEIVQKSLNWQEFMKIISTKTKIKQVKLQGCYFSNEAISYQGFFNFSQGSNLGINLQKLDFSYCVNLGARQWNEIFQNVFFLKNLKELILEFCNLDDQKVDCILNHNIEKNTNQNNNFMGQSRDDQINFDRNITQTLEKLSLKGNQMIFSQGYSKIFQFLVLCKNFKKLYLSENGLTWTKIKGINVQILQKSPTFLENLQILKFCRNKNLEPNGWSHLFEIFKGVKNLNELRISDCRFTDEKFHRIKQGILGLNCNQSLKTIDFFGNGLLSKTSWSIFFKDIVFRHDNLENLYIGCCNLNGNIIENVCEKIKDEIRNRVEKNYNFSQEKAFYERYSNQFKKILGKESQKNFRVDSLILDGNIRFKPSQWHQLFSNLVYFDNLRAISLGKCYLDIQKIEQIVSAVEEFENMEIDESSDQKIISKNGKPKKVKKQRANSSVKSVIYCKSFYKNIKHFNFSGNKYINQEGWKKLFQFLEKFQNLQVLQLNNCDLDDQIVKFFADSLKKSKDLRSSLTQIEFGSNQKVTQKGWVYLFRSFKKCTFLENLNLSNCNLDYQCMQAFCDIFEVGTSMIEKVNINCNINIEKKGFDIFFERICKINGITKIDLSMTKLNDSKIQELVIGLKNQLPITQSLNSLMLMGNHKISNEGWESLFQGINNCDNFQQLQLQVCKLTGSIIKRLIRNSQKLKQNLRHFNILGNPDIKRNHMADLIMYLFEFKRLEYLNLGMCDLDTDLVVDLEQKLYIIKNNKKEVKSNLKTLELIGNNRISSFGWEKLFNLIVNQMPKIQKIGLRKCELNDEDLAKIISEWKNRPPICKSIKQIFLQNNPDISVQGYVDFIKNGLSFIFFFSRSFSAFYRRIKNSERRISTQYINDFYCLCSHIEFNAVADVLDFIAPYNVVVIPNNCITRIILPQFYGKAINNKVLVSILTFIFEDIPQLLLGLAFIFQNEQKYTFNVISVIVMSLISLIIAFYNFMSIRPSILNQMDFDELIKKKKEDYNQNVQQYLSMEQKLMNYWIDYHLSDRKSYNIESEMLDEQILNLEVDNKFQPQRQTGHRQTEIQQQQMFKIDNLNVKANSKNNDINDIDSSPYKSKSFIYQQVNDGKILNQSSQVLQK